MWFAYVWIVIIGLIWLVWTLGAVIDVMEQWDYAENVREFLGNLIEAEIFMGWFAIHMIITFVASVIYFLHVYG